MLLLLNVLSLLQGAVAAPVVQQLPETPHSIYDGRARQLSVHAPRLESEVQMDGSLDEPVWRDAALLTGFSLYQPIDGRPAPDSTEVLVWYSPTALYVGVRAFEPHAAVHATLADRDRVSGDDNVELHLDTFHDLRRAFVFIVNPLGIQADGTKSEGGGFIPGSNVMPGQNDLSADFLWQSKGHITPWGYEVEMRIPFKSLRYPMHAVQDWGIQIVRNVQHSGYQETWTPARRASASFIAQEGTLVGLRDLHHGQVVELNPELTSTISGAPAARPDGTPGEWHYARTDALGGNVKWGLGSDFVLNGTVKPDFSQVEADATQIASDLRFALFYPEKRPFFVEGSDQFNVPNTLVYTRQIVHPTAAAKLTGILDGTEVAFMSALDDPGVSRVPGENPAASILRLQRGFSGQSTAGLLVSDREEGPQFNRLAGGDVHVVFGRMYFAQLQAVASATNAGSGTHTAPMWEAVLDRTGRSFGFHYNVIGIHPDFAAWNGFVPRTGYVQANVLNRFTAYGHPGSLFERYNVFLTSNALWRYDDVLAGRSILEDRLSANNQLTFRGGWSVAVQPALASYAFDPASYGGLVVLAPSPAGVDTLPFTASPRLGTALLGANISTPQYRRWDASASITGGRDIDFRETSRVRRLDVNASVDWRPTEQLRVSGSYASTALARRAGGATTTRIRIPRLRAEYQLSRSVFVRFVGQYTAITGDSVVRDWRTGLPVFDETTTGLVPATRALSSAFRVDWLFSYRPTPGTVFFFGYGSSLTEQDPLAFRNLHRETDGFFVKGSYLFRM